MAISNTTPPASFQRGGKTVVTFNVVQTQVTDPQTGATRTQFEYDEVEGADLVVATKNMESVAALKLSGLETMSYDALDAYIEANFTTLATAKVFVKKLAKVVLAILKTR